MKNVELRVGAEEKISDRGDLEVLKWFRQVGRRSEERLTTRVCEFGCDERRDRGRRLTRLSNAKMLFAVECSGGAL